MAADSHFHLQRLLGTHGNYTSLGEGLGTSTPTPVIVDPVVPSYCWPNTWQEILRPRPPEARYAALGWHPTLAAHLSDALLETYELIVDRNIKAVGEVGLDYHCIRMKPKEEKKHLIQQQKSSSELCARWHGIVVSLWLFTVGMLLIVMMPPRTA